MTRVNESRFTCAKTNEENLRRLKLRQHFKLARLVHKNETHWGVAKWLRHRVLIPAFEGSNPSTPAISFNAHTLILKRLLF